MMKVVPARLSSKYQLVIPKEIRQRLQLEPKTMVLFILEEDTVILRPKPDDFTEALCGLHAELWPDPDGWLEEERATWED
jgi:AbrB family looped-hinge helix DNA binding protein